MSDKDKTNKTARDVRQQLLNRSDEIIDTFLDVALGKKKDDFDGVYDMLEVAFKAVVPMVKMNDDVMELPELDNADAYENKGRYVDAVIKAMALGKITTEQSNFALSAIEKATNVIEIQEIVKKLSALEGNDAR